MLPSHEKELLMETSLVIFSVLGTIFFIPLMARFGWYVLVAVGVCGIAFATHNADKLIGVGILYLLYLAAKGGGTK
jgi:hypothetical protein